MKPKPLTVELPKGFEEEAKRFSMEPLGLAKRILEAFVREKRKSFTITRKEPLHETAHPRRRLPGMRKIVHPSGSAQS